MKRSITGLLVSAVLLLGVPALSLAMDVWSVENAFTAKVQVRYIDGNGSQVVINRTLINEIGGVGVEGPDSEGNALLGVIMNTSDSEIVTYALGNVVTSGSKGVFSGSFDDGLPALISLDNHAYYMLPADVNASYADASATVNPTTNTMNIKIKITVVGLLHTPNGDFPAKIIIFIGNKAMPHSDFIPGDTLDRPFAPAP